MVKDFATWKRVTIYFCVDERSLRWTGTGAEGHALFQRWVAARTSGQSDIVLFQDRDANRYVDLYWVSEAQVSK